VYNPTEDSSVSDGSGISAVAGASVTPEDRRDRGITLDQGAVMVLFRSCLLCLCPAVLVLTMTASSAQSTQRVPANQAGTTRAWEALEKKDYRAAITHADAVITEFGRQANEKQAALAKSKSPKPPEGPVTDDKVKKAVFANGLLNDVATCLFIKGEALEKTGKAGDAKSAYDAACKLTYARTWDPGGSFWDPATKSCDRAARIK